MVRSSYKVGGALAALGLIACAHGGRITTTTSHIPAGRAAQPFGWPESLVNTPEAQPVTVAAAPGGRAAQPFGWPARLVGAYAGPLSTEPATAYVGGRAAQPFSWREEPVAKTPAEIASARGGSSAH
jgi:hypothetical protein